MFNLISKHRNSIMGISAIVILVHHYFTNILDKQYKIGAIGVDIFMFVMGLGLYFSLFKDAEQKSFFKGLPSYFFRRAKKILPVFAVFLVFWGIWKFNNGGFTLKAYLLNLSLTGYWTLSYNDYFNWFVSGILLFYFLSPFFFLLIYKTKYKMSSTFILFVLISILTYLFRKNEQGEITRTLIMIVRLIPFSFGMLFGAFCKESPSKQKRNFCFGIFALLFVFGIVLYVLNNLYWNDTGFIYGMPWYSFGLMTPFICIVTAYFLEIISKYTKLISSVSSFFGKMSFEIYLTHVFVIEYILYFLKRKENLWFSEPYNFLAAFFVSALFAYVLHCFSEKVNSVGEKQNTLQSGK